MATHGTGTAEIRWGTEMACEILKRYHAQLHIAGITAAYLEAADNTYDPDDADNLRQVGISDLARRPYPLLAYTDTDNQGYSDIVLTKVDPWTGVEAHVNEGNIYYDASVFVAATQPNSTLYEASDHFTHAQVALIGRQAKDLRRLGLIPGRNYPALHDGAMYAHLLGELVAEVWPEKSFNM